MDMDMTNPVAIVQERLSRQRSLDDRSAACVTVLAERLEQLKAMNPAFEAIRFSPELEAMMARQMTAVVN